MGIRLFIRDHFVFIIFQLLVTVFILSIFWLEGFRDTNTATYVITISLLLICSFLVIRYMLRRKFYQKILTSQRRWTMHLIKVQKQLKTLSWSNI